MSGQGGAGEAGGGVIGAVVWAVALAIGGYLDWRSKQAKPRAARRADERLAAQGAATLAAIEEERSARGPTLGEAVGEHVRRSKRKRQPTPNEQEE